MTLSKKNIFKLVQNNEIESVKKLIENGLDVNLVKNKSNDHTNLLNVAVKYASLEMVELLVENGAKTLFVEDVTDIAFRRDDEAIKVLSYYFPLLQKWTYEYYCNNYERQIMSEETIQFIHDVIYFNTNLPFADIIQAIRAHERLGIRTEKLNTYVQCSFLSLESAGHSYEITKYLLELGIRPSMLLNPITSAATAGNVANIKLLLEYGAKINQACTKDGYPLEASVVANQYEATKFLLENGADVNCKFKHLLLKTAILHIQSTKHLSDSKFIEEREKENEKAKKLISLLLQYNSPIDEDEGDKFVSALSSVSTYEIMKMFEPYLDKMSDQSNDIYHENIFQLLLQG